MIQICYFLLLWVCSSPNGGGCAKALGYGTDLCSPMTSEILKQFQQGFRLCNHVIPKWCLWPCATWVHITPCLIHLFYSIRCTARFYFSSYFSLTLFCCQNVKSDKKHCFSLNRVQQCTAHHSLTLFWQEIQMSPVLELMVALLSHP